MHIYTIVVVIPQLRIHLMISTTHRHAGVESVAWPVTITTLWNTNVRKQAINDKLQGNVAT